MSHFHYFPDYPLMPVRVTLNADGHCLMRMDMLLPRPHNGLVVQLVPDDEETIFSTCTLEDVEWNVAERRYYAFAGMGSPKMSKSAIIERLTAMGWAFHADE